MASILRKILSRFCRRIPFCAGTTAERDRDDRRLQEYVGALEAANHCLEEYSFTAQAATRAKSEFLANMSHELRSPLTAILGYADLLRTEDDPLQAPPARIEATEAIIRNGEHLLQLINDVLDLSKIEAGRFDADKGPCSPLKIIHDVRDLTEVSARAKQLPFRVEYAGPIPATICSDGLRIRQILINLVANAVKFTDRGCVRLRTSLAESGTAGAAVEFAVIDTGIGMTPQQIEMIFRPFSQADRTVSERYGGTGLGLAISRKLANLLGGEIQVASAPGQGSTFRLTIPVGALEGVEMIDAPDEAAAAPSPAHVESAALPAFDRLDARILLAEDSPDCQRLLSVVLEKEGVKVTSVDDGAAAVDQATAAWRRGEPFDIVLMDMQMPILDGYEAVRQLRRSGYPHPIVALTAHAMREDRGRCLEAGCDDYATKPIQRDSLLSLVARHLKTGEGISGGLSPWEI